MYIYTNTCICRYVVYEITQIQVIMNIIDSFVYLECLCLYIDWRCALVLQLLMKMLFPRGPSIGATFIQCFKVCYTDMCMHYSINIIRYMPYFVFLF